MDFKRMICIGMMVLMILLPIAVAQSMNDGYDSVYSVDIDGGSDKTILGSFGRLIPLEDKLISSRQDKESLMQWTVGGNVTTNGTTVNATNASTLSADIPSLTTKDMIDVTVTSLANNTIELKTKFDLRRLVSENGTAKFMQIKLEKGNNTISLKSTSPIGNITSKDYYIFLDTEALQLTVSQIPSMVADKQITITGSVNKMANVEIYVKEGAVDTQAPKTPAGLSANSTNPNMVSLKWEQSTESDLFQYVIYRSDKGPIATAQQNYVMYQDIQVDGGATYQYSISAMDKGCLESPKSAPVSVVTLAGGRSPIADKALPITVPCNPESGMKKIINITTNSSFSQSVPLQSGANIIIIKASDSTNHTSTETRNVNLDSEPFIIEITSPRKGTAIYESFANSVKIEGKTKPNAKVELAKEGINVIETSSNATNPVLPQVNITVGDVKASTKADDAGLFSFEDVNLLNYVRSSAMLDQVDVGDESLAGRTNNLGGTQAAHIMFRATDQMGRQITTDASYSIVTCWSGNFTWGITPLTQYQSPAWLSAERLSEGTEEISFYLNFTYHGLGNVDTKDNKTIRSQKVTRVSSLSIRSACDQYIRTQPKYDWACKALSSCRAVINPDGNMAYVTCHLNKVKEIEDFDGKEMKDWFKAINNEMRFPFTMTLAFQEEIEGQQQRGSQTSCEEVTFPVDNSQINFSKVLPDWLLNDGVKLMDDAVKNIDKINKQLRQVLKYLAIGCVGSFIARFAVQVSRRISCSYDNVYSKVEGAISVSGDQQDNMNKCNICLSDFAREDKQFQGLYEAVSKPVGFLTKPDVQNKIPDACMEVCYPSCARAWNYEYNVYQFYRWTCDRVFCHTAPSRWTETKTDYELKEKAKTVKTCSKDQSMKGLSLNGAKCIDLPESQRKDFKEAVGEDDLCFNFYNEQAQSKSIFVLKGSSAPQSENIYRLELQRGVFEANYIYAIKVSDKYFLTSRQDTCAKACNLKDNASTNSIVLAPGQKNLGAAGQPEGGKAVCTTVTNCRDLQNQGNVTLKDGSVVNVKSSYTEGFTKDCFYSDKSDAGELGSATVVGDNPDQRYECCCLNTIAVKDDPRYYQFNDSFIQKDTSGSLFGLFGGGKKDGEGGAAAPSATASYINKPNNFSEMKWSYRYWKIQYANKMFNPDRYVKGRDQSACFGQNNWIFDGFSANKEEGGNLLKVDPFKQHTSAFQCGCLTGIINRLTMVQNILMLMSGCLKEVRTTGKGDAGVCKELFTQYVCTLMWEIISYLQSGCIPLFGGIDFDAKEESAGQMLKVGTTSVFDTMKDNMGELQSEYGNAKISSMLGGGEGSIARAICLAAFGFDWEISLDTILDAAYSTPFATLVQTVSSSREYMSFDPRGGQPKYEYRASWIINPGCDFDSYDVSLACVSDDDMRSHPEIDCSGIECDCAYLKGNGPIMRFYSGRSLQQNKLEDKSNHAVVLSRYRFDHIKITLRTSRQIQRYAPGAKTNCFPQGHEDGVFYFPIKDRSAQSIIGCGASVDSGVFYCEGGDIMWNQEGNAYINSASLNGKSISSENLVLKLGDEVIFESQIYNSGKPKCLYMELTKPGQAVQAFKQTIDFNGSQSLQVDLGKAEFVGTGASGYSGSSRLRDCFLRKPSTDMLLECTNQIPKEERDNIGHFVTEPNNFVQSSVEFYDQNNNNKIDLNTKETNDTVLIDGVSYPIKDFLNATTLKTVLNISGNQFQIDKMPNLGDNIYKLTYLITSGTTASDRTSQRWELKYGIYYISEDGFDCNDMIEGDVVVDNNGNKIEVTKSFAIKEIVDNSTGGTGGAGSGQNATPCDMNGKENKEPCDCDGDGKIYQPAARGYTNTSDCDGALRKYCVPIGVQGVHKCFGRCSMGSLTNSVPCECNGDGFLNMNQSNNPADCAQFDCICRGGVAESIKR